MKKNKVTLKIISLVIVVDLLESLYELFLKKGMLTVGEFHISTFAVMNEYAIRVLSNGWIWMGLSILIIETLMWFVVLSKIDLSVAFPLASSSYIFILIASVFFLHEPVSINRWIGTALVILGIYLVTKSSQEESGSDLK